MSNLIIIYSIGVCLAFYLLSKDSKELISKTGQDEQVFWISAMIVSLLSWVVVILYVLPKMFK